LKDELPLKLEIEDEEELLPPLEFMEEELPQLTHNNLGINEAIKRVELNRYIERSYEVQIVHSLHLSLGSSASSWCSGLMENHSLDVIAGSPCRLLKRREALPRA
jgi:hypothetical protein